jgi:hypothetical protein
MIILFPIEFLIEFLPLFDCLLLPQPHNLHLLSVLLQLLAPLLLSLLDPHVHLLIREVHIPDLLPDFLSLLNECPLECECLVPYLIQRLVRLMELLLAQSAPLLEVLHLLIQLDGRLQHRQLLQVRQILQHFLSFLVHLIDLLLDCRRILLLISCNISLDLSFNFFNSCMLDRVHVNLELHNGKVSLKGKLDRISCFVSYQVVSDINHSHFCLWGSQDFAKKGTGCLSV